jgi:hypothetical protein
MRKAMRLSRQVLYETLCFVLICSVGCVARPKLSENTGILLGPPPDFEKQRIFQKLTKAEPGSEEFEKMQIEYLFERLRETRYNFVRNGKPYSNARAVIHLRWKLFRYSKEAETARAFVDWVAAGSRATGRPYLMKTGDGNFYLLKMIFYNELKLLEQAYTDHLNRVLNASEPEGTIDEAAIGKQAETSEGVIVDAEIENVQETAQEADNSIVHA